MVVVEDEAEQVQQEALMKLLLSDIRQTPSTIRHQDNKEYYRQDTSNSRSHDDPSAHCLA